MITPMNVLLIEDDLNLVDALSRMLASRGFQVVCCADGAEALVMARRRSFDVALLDLTLPGMDGLDWLQHLRDERSRLPVLVMTARSAVEDRVLGLNSGADDYLTKPFEPEELLACIRSLLRRGGEDAAADPEVTAFGDLTLHMGTFLLECGPRSVRLSRREYDLMELLMRNPGRVYSRENLLNVVWGYEYIGDFRTVDVHIRRLREKLELDPANPEYIRTKWGVGYYLSARGPRRLENV